MILGRSTLLRPAVHLGLVCSLSVLVGCADNGEPTRETDRPQPHGTAMPLPRAMENLSAYQVAPDSRADAQKRLDAAEESLIAAPTGHYSMRWLSADKDETLIRAEFDLGIPAGRQVFLQDGGQTLEMRLIEADSWARPTVRGEEAECWMHFSRGSSEVARTSAFLPGAYPLLEPKADGRLAGGSRDQIVVDLLLDEAVAIAAPKLAQQASSDIDPQATVPGLVTLDGGEYSSLEYSMGDVAALLEESGSSLAERLGELMATGHSWSVRVDYTKLGADVEVTPPLPETVIEMGDPEQLSLDREPPPCEAAQ